MIDLEHETEVPERTQASAVRSCKRVYKSIYNVHLISYVIPKCRLNSIHVRKKKTNVGQPTYDETAYFSWEDYENGESSARQLLKACSYLNGPASS